MAYDSRTDAPRLRHGHKYCRSEFTRPREVQTADEAVAEGLAEWEEAA